ncbi:MAG: single-stranded-DNA-specific exonuclease RecJ [Pirellulales bacterium]|nr:single-stranded-DNA-specific exonuclease RecJ [Pirellulales bacterium]
MPKIWRKFPHDAARIRDLEQSARIPAVVAQLLICRGIIDPRQVREFLDPKLTQLRDPAELPGIPNAVEEIMAAVATQQPIVVYGDYDADGMTATAILYDCLRLLGAVVSYYVPNRLDEGYGLNEDAIRQLAARGTKLLVTVDCGIASWELADTARELGLRLVITDHHEFGQHLPAAHAIVHPRLPGSAYPFGELCGAGVAFKLAWALCQHASQSKKVTEKLRHYLLQAVGLAAIGTVADVVPLIDENRVLVRYGLTSILQYPVLGLEKLLSLTKLRQKQQLDAEDIGFNIAPRLNAAGRLGQATLGVELLTTTNPERAAALAEYLHDLNSSRDSIERSIYLAALKQAQEQYDPVGDAALVLAGKEWHPGVIGIVAGKLADKFHRPVVMIALDEMGIKPGVGSARSVPGVNLHHSLAACAEYLLTHGGHAAAAGLKIDPAQVDNFREAFVRQIAAEFAHASGPAELSIDAETTFSALTMKVVEQLEQLAPFGHGNTRPMLCASDVELIEPPKRMGGDGRHLSLRLVQHGTRIRGVAFGAGEWAEALQAHGGPVQLAFRPVINEFQGRRSVEIQITDWQGQ